MHHLGAVSEAEQLGLKLVLVQDVDDTGDSLFQYATTLPVPQHSSFAIFSIINMAG